MSARATLVDVTTDKVDVEVPATASGTIAQIHGGRRRHRFRRRDSRRHRYVEVQGNGAGPPQRTAAAATPREPKIVEVTLPEMGESVTEGSIVEVQREDRRLSSTRATALVDVTTDKVDVEVPAPVSGTIVAIHVKAGDTVSVGA